MEDYSVLIECAGSVEIEPAVLDDLLDALEPWAAAVSGTGGRFSVRLSVSDDHPAAAAVQALKLLSEYGEKVSLPPALIVRLEVLTAAELDRELGEPNFPDVVGSSEAQALLGVSRQRFGDLRRRPDFPEPVLELAATPLWLRAALTAFVERWDRRPGRPAGKLLFTTANRTLMESLIEQGAWRDPDTGQVYEVTITKMAPTPGAPADQWAVRGVPIDLAEDAD